MNYFVSCLYGDYEKYQQIKKDLCLKENDRLWILGDILDGNDEDPEANLELLNDIMDSPNITLLLGDHEYARCMEYNSSGDAEIAKSWREYSNSLEVSGASFNEFVTTSFSKEDRDTYFGAFLSGSCELSAVIPIGKRYFYAVHGCPMTFAHSILSEWQLMTCSGNPDFKKDVWKSIKTDEFSIPYIKNTKNPMCKENTIAIVGQMSASKAIDMLGFQDNGSGVIFANKTLAIGRTFPDEPIPVVGIDAAGFFVKGLY